MKHLKIDNIEQTLRTAYSAKTVLKRNLNFKAAYTNNNILNFSNHKLKWKNHT